MSLRSGGLPSPAAGPNSIALVVTGDAVQFLLSRIYWQFLFVRQTIFPLEVFTFASRHDRHHANGHTISPEIAKDVPAQRQAMKKTRAGAVGAGETQQ
jgi:hypothetical protein